MVQGELVTSEKFIDISGMTDFLCCIGMVLEVGDKEDLTVEQLSALEVRDECELSVGDCGSSDEMN